MATEAFLLRSAIKRGDNDQVQLAISRGGDDGINDELVSYALHLQPHNTTMLKILTKSERYIPDVITDCPYTHLQTVICFPDKADLSMANVLLESGSDPKRLLDGTSMLLDRLGVHDLEKKMPPDLEAISWLLLHGVDANVRNSGGTSALDLAISLGLHNIVREMVERGAKINLPDVFGDIPILQAINNGDLDMVRVFATDPTMVNVAIEGGERPLHRAVTRKQQSVVNFLLSTGADPNVKDGKGHTPLQYAWNNHDEDICRSLFEYGGRGAFLVDYDIDSESGTRKVKLIIPLYEEQKGGLT
jgi:hypothetical protein